MELVRFLVGTLLSVNFVIFWSLPIMLQGLMWKHFASAILLPLYQILDDNKFLRYIAVNFVYTNPIHADFFATSLLILLNTFVSVGFVFYWQLTYGSLPWWLIYAYYFAWVGTGGRIMGGAYALAHKEGHNRSMYKKWIRESVGNIMENHIGCFFGNVPWNFTTSHIFIHHRLDGGVGDTFYLWDLDRTSLYDFMLYIYRISLHMSGYSSWKFFEAHGEKRKADLLLQGIYWYWIEAAVILLITRSLAFVFFIYIQPFFCMSYFLALLNIGFHGFLDFDANGKSIAVVNATTLIEGDDDYFGEDDHMAHHYNSNVYWRDLPTHQKSKIEEFKKYSASVFKKLSVLELSIFIIFRLWDKIAEHYVDYTGKLSKEEIINMLKTRAVRKEISYDVYEKYLANPTAEARKALLPNVLEIPPEVDKKEK